MDSTNAKGTEGGKEEDPDSQKGLGTVVQTSKQRSRFATEVAALGSPQGRKAEKSKVGISGESDSVQDQRLHKPQPPYREWVLQRQQVPPHKKVQKNSPSPKEPRVRAKVVRFDLGGAQRESDIGRRQ